MSLKVLIVVNLIILTFSLKETQPLYKAMTELNPGLQKEACRFKLEKEDNEFIYVKPCEEGSNCGNNIDDISTCIPNYIGQKLGETCNYKAECLFGHCDEEKHKCTFTKNDKPKHFEIEDINRCGNGLFYLEKNKNCVEKTDFDYLEGYCRYTKKGGKEINIQPISPFYVCGESGFATKDDPNLQEGSAFTKITKIGTLDNGKKTVSEYACKTGGVIKEKEDDEFWTCDNIKSVKKVTGQDGLISAEYEFEIVGKKTITIEEYDGVYFYRDELTGDIIPYGFEYLYAFKDYANTMRKYEKSCKENSHDYYFRPFDCGIKQISDAYFYLNYLYFYKKDKKEAIMVRDFLLNQDFDTWVAPTPSNSPCLKFNKSILMLIIILSLL